MNNIDEATQKALDLQAKLKAAADRKATKNPVGVNIPKPSTDNLHCYPLHRTSIISYHALISSLSLFPL
jgi:hypothetical protein